MEKRIELVRGDITKIKADAIVNAANPSLLGGGGVDGAIHQVAGPELVSECRLLGGCRTGEAKITKGYRLPAKYVIHTVGPVWGMNGSHEEELLANCYRNSLALATSHNCRIVAFPNISTGVYHFPKDKAGKIAIREVKAYLEAVEIPDKVIFVCYDEENYEIYHHLLDQ